MELTELKDKIISSFTGTKEELQDVLDLVEVDNAVFPFNEYEFLICNLIEKKGLSYCDYLAIRQEYIDQNPNLWIFEIAAPRGFGEKFAQTHLKGICKDLQKPSKKLDSGYNGEYDFWLDGIKIEVKASRAVDKQSTEPLYCKALSKNSKRPFLMNFQQLKPNCCDVFIWLAVFRDEIVIWVMSSDDVQNNSYFTPQHRNKTTAERDKVYNKEDIFEGQIMMTEKNICEFDIHKFSGENLKVAIKNAAKRK